jgi:hypothetical protein
MPLPARGAGRQGPRGRDPVAVPKCEKCGAQAPLRRLCTRTPVCRAAYAASLEGVNPVFLEDDEREFLRKWVKGP